MTDDLEDEEQPEEDRSAQVAGALVKVVVVIAAIALVVALGTVIAVKALGLNGDDSYGPVGSAPAEPAKPLPTKALDVPGQDQGSESPAPSDSPSADSAKTGDIELDISPVKARPNE